MTGAPDRAALPFPEFVTLTALMISLLALSIDAMLPALPAIGQDLGVSDPNDNQLVLSAMFLGFAVGQIFYGPISDSTGRKPAVCAGLVIFTGGCLLSIFAGSFTEMLVGRFLQGLGVAGPRVVMVALVRDQFAGRAMARVMSIVMAVFILVPVLAPALGQGILLFAGWRAIFYAILGLAAIAFVWFAWRQPETLSVARRVPLSLRRIGTAVLEVCRNRIAFGYTLTAGLVFGAFLGFLSSVQQILQQQYALGVLFPLAFAGCALSVGAAAYLNSRLVMRYGMRLLSRRALWALTLVSGACLPLAGWAGGHPPLWLLLAYLLVTLFFVGILFGNLNALAMEPLGHIAGVGAAVVGSVSTFVSLPLGIAVGQSYNQTVLPLIAGFAVLGAASLWVAHRVERGAQVPP